jgi:glycosyltransferase involved in cell wall biosynthesis
MTIVHVTPYYAPAWAWGGVVTAVWGLARAQAAAGHRVAVITTDTLGPGIRGRAGTTVEDGIAITRVSTRWPGLRARLNLSWPRGIGPAVRLAAAGHDRAVVHCHEPRTFETVAAVRAARAVAVPVVLSPHGTLPLVTGRAWAKRAWDASWSRATWRAASHVVALTGAEAADVAAFVARWRLDHLAGRCTIVPHGVDAAGPGSDAGRIAARTAFGIPGDRPVVLFLGRIHPRKRIERLVDAVAAGHAATAHLLIAGPDAGARAAIVRRAAAHGLPNVSLPGLLTGDARQAAYAAADVFVLPADGEGLPMAALEALAAGVPVIATPGAQLDAVAEAGAGLVAAATAEALAEALASILDDPARRAAMSAAARRLAVTRYDWAHAVARLDGVYERALAAAPADPAQGVGA